MEHKPSESELFDYMEGNLPAEQHAAVKKYLEANADSRSELAAAQRGADSLAKFEVNASVDVVADVLKKINVAPSSTGYLKYVLLVAGVLILIVAGLFLRPPEPEVQTPAPVVVPAVSEPEAPAVPPLVIARTPESPVYSEVFELTSGEERTVENQKIGTIRLAGPGSYVISEDNVQIARGHAFFEIKQRESGNAFTVSTDDAEIVVVGTSFGVIKELQSTEVVLVQGRLRIEAAGTKHDLTSSFTAVISGSAYAVAKITGQQAAFWSDFPASLYRSPAPSESHTGPKIPDTTPEHSEGNNEPASHSSDGHRSPLDVLNEWSVPKSELGN